jgi:tripartite ATP-independent transporter DctM subunit
VTLLVLVLIFVAALTLSVPIAIAFGLAAIFALMTMDFPFTVLSQRMFASMDSFPFLAIPFFILAGQLMNVSGLTPRLIAFCNSLVGHLRGGLAYVTILSSIVFAGISGVATAEAAALGSILIPGMAERGYSRSFAAALTAAASVVGPIIPPSVAMVIYSLVLGGRVSIGGLFMAGAIPGLLIGAALVALVYMLPQRLLGKPDRPQTGFSARAIVRAGWGSMWALLVPVVIIGGMLGGIVTATEAAAIAVAYTLLIGTVVLRQISFRQLRGALEVTVYTTAIIGLLLATSEIVTWIVNVQQVPARLSGFLLDASLSPQLFMILTVVFILILGIPIEPVPLMVMFAPILAPVAETLGIHPLHFGLVFVLAAEVGMITPPVGAVLYVVCGVGKVKLEELSRAILPFVMAEIIMVVLVALIPTISLWLPRALGFP